MISIARSRPSPSTRTPAPLQRPVRKTVATRTRKGENTLAEPFIAVPGAPIVDAATFEGVVEETRELEGRLRWWPRGGVDVALTAGYRWVDDAGHVAGARLREPRGTLALQLVR